MNVSNMAILIIAAVLLLCRLLYLLHFVLKNAVVFFHENMISG